MTVSFVVKGIPAAEPRARARAIRTKAGKLCATVYSGRKEKHNAWRAAIVEAANKAFGHRRMGQAPIRIMMSFWMPMPKGIKEIQPSISKPDLDNLAKLVLDALVQYRFIPDDRFVYALDLLKSYRPSSGAMITIKDMDSYG